MSEPRVSVVIPTFNRSAFLRQAIVSVLAQTYPHFEVIISDNASADDTREVVAAFSDPRIRYFQNERNLGMAPNWNAGIRRARGAYVVLLEDDNWWHAEYLARAVSILDRHPEVAFLHTAVRISDAKGRVRHVFRRWRSDRICDKRAELIDLMQGNKIFLSTVMARRSAIESVGLFDETILFTADWDMWLRMYAYHDGAYVAEPLVFYRQHEESVSRQFHSQPVLLFEDHGRVIERTLQRIGEVYGAGFAGRIRKVSYRWLARARADVQASRAWETYLGGGLKQAREEAGLALKWDLSVALRFPFRLLVITLTGLRPHGFGRSIAAMESRLGRWLARYLL